MPTYEYVCQECGKRFEIACHENERKRLAVCPKCKSKKVEAAFSSFVCPRPKSTF